LLLSSRPVGTDSAEPALRIALTNRFYLSPLPLGNATNVWRVMHGGLSPPRAPALLESRTLTCRHIMFSSFVAEVQLVCSYSLRSRLAKVRCIRSSAFRRTGGCGLLGWGSPYVDAYRMRGCDGRTRHVSTAGNTIHECFRVGR
jgi:hypothetical protein